MPPASHHDLPPQEDERPGDWLDVAAAVLHHQLRGPWFVGIALLALVGPAIALLVHMSLPDDLRHLLGTMPQMGWLGFVERSLPVLLLLMTILGFRGAWLRDSSAAVSRIAGYFAGTWVAVAAALLPWAVAAFGVMTLHETATDAFLVPLAHLAGLLLLSAAWIAIGLLLAVVFQRQESQWAALGLTWAVVAVLLPHVSEVILQVESLREMDFQMPVPTWILALDVLSPSRLHDLYLGTLIGAWGGGYHATYPTLFSPYVMGALLALWAAAALAVAMRVQGRRRDPPF